jgi:hypothetical protein
LRNRQHAIAIRLAATNAAEHQVAAQMLERGAIGYRRRGFSGEALEHYDAALGRRLLLGG